MRVKKTGPLPLFALATASVLVLVLLSDFDPEVASELATVEEEPIEMTLVVMSCRACENGHILNVSDGLGGEGDAFCPADVFPQEVSSGTAVRVAIIRSTSDRDFFIIQKIIPVARSGKD